MQNSILGYDDYLIRHLEDSIGRAQRIRFNVAFLMESGARVIARQLMTAASRGVPVEILTGRYMGVTEPPAIFLLLDALGNSVDIRFFSDTVRSFHPKAYIFDYPDGGEVYIGSSNLSYSALTSGVEWNYRLDRSQSPQDFDRFSIAFNNLFQNQATRVSEEVLREYAQSWKKPGIFKWESAIRAEQIEPEPFGAQIEALYELKLARDEGVEKGLVIAATGVGKTYISAFDSKDFRKVLFVAHREEILKQAKDTFKKVRPHSRVATSINQSTLNADIYFSTIQTLSRQKNLEGFPSDFFDYLVIDEFHHAAADSYLQVLKHFKPKFLLGLTATPYRTDNRDIFDLCDDNIVYEIGLKEAINRDLLSPFHYYGIYDETDYSMIDVRNGKYVQDQLERELSRSERAELILEHFNRFNGRHKKAIGFCASVKHAEYMADYFAGKGIKAVCVHSSSPSSDTYLNREDSISGLKDGSIQIVFSVDIFNEGVDVPALDMVLFLRPTESFTVFLQQLGRGLRKAPSKDCLVVLDFIGNYRRAHYVPSLLAGKNPMSEKATGEFTHQHLEFPEDCVVNFDFKLLDLFETLSKSDPLKKRMVGEYFRVKDILGRRPSRFELYEATDIPFREYLKDGWLRFLGRIHALSEEEAAWLDTPAEEFLKELEKTSMTKAYKVPTIGSLLLDDSGIQQKVNLRDVGKNMRSFYRDNPTYHKDLMDKSSKDWQNWDDERFARVAKDNPIKYLARSSFFHYDEINKVFYLDDSLNEYLSPLLALHIKDILQYRTVNFFHKRYREEP